MNTFLRLRITFLAALLAAWLFITMTAGAAPLRILPFGDSITKGFQEQPFGSYRYFLENELSQRGIEFDFVGSQSLGEEGMNDAQHEGYPGAKIEFLTSIDTTPFNPDVVLLLAGTNNHGDEPNAAAFYAKYTSLFDSIGDVPTIVATVPSFGYPRPEFSVWTQDWVDERNNVRFPLMNQVLFEIASARNNITVVDYNSSFDPEIHLVADQVHPNTAGHELLAALFLPELLVFTAPTWIPGDINQDSTVNRSDMVQLVRQMGSTGGTWATGDFDNNGVTGLSDLALLQANLGATIPLAASLTTVPEPSTLTLLWLGSSSLFAIRFRHRRVRSLATG